MVSYAGAGVAVRRDREHFRRMERVWAKGIADFARVSVTVQDESGMRDDAGYVVVTNHASYFDIVVLFMALPIVPGFIAKKELAKVPFLAQALDLGGHVLIDRGNRSRAKASLDQAARQVRAGRTVLVFPEGTRSKTGRIEKFKLGAFHLALAAGVPIVPVGIAGSRDVMPGEGLIYPGTVRVRIGAPITAADVAAEAKRTTEPKALAEAARARVSELSGIQLA